MDKPAGRKTYDVKIWDGRQEKPGRLTIESGPGQDRWVCQSGEYQWEYTPPRPNTPRSAPPYFGDEALAALQSQMAEDGCSLMVCGTCGHFHSSGMSHQMSGGWMGYCLHTKGRETLSPTKDTVDILHLCSHYISQKEQERAPAEWTAPLPPLEETHPKPGWFRSLWQRVWRRKRKISKK